MLTDVSFYEDDNCEGPKLTTGSTICSGIWSGHSCSSAFDESLDTKWASQMYVTAHGNGWIGKTFPTKPDIRCVTITVWGWNYGFASNWNAHHVIVEERNDGSSDWTPINNMELTATDSDYRTTIRLYDPPPAYSIRVRNMDG